MKHSFICALLLSTLAFSAVATQRVSYSSPSDPGVINQERILYWLEKRGQLAANADEITKKLALENYLNKKSFDKKQLPSAIAKQVKKAERLALQSSISTLKGVNKTAALSSSSSNEVETIEKVLAIMIDFPDLKHDDNGLTPSDTAMYYSNYTQQHYNDLLFAGSGYTGPSGQSIISSYQYYQQESGGTFFFTGQANGWVTADNEAKYYGENDADNNFDDKNVPALVLEAVTKAVAKGIDLTEYDLKDPYDSNGNGVIDEPDGIIDHVMIFHSSIGEEAGGGVLAEDAIWSHRFYVFDDRNQPVTVPGSTVKLYGYTINPIDAATGVTVHEFGHDLGLDDEYDTDNGALGSPVGNWSVMASGSWLGSPGGTSPATFSPLARDYLSERYQGNWINQLEVDFSALASKDINLVAANNHQSGINQVKVSLPPKQIDFGTPVQGLYQYYSGKENQQDSRLSFDVSLPIEAATLTMTARWDIESDWDYVQVLINGTPIVGSHTKATNSERPSVTNYISGNSADLTDKYGELAWVDLSFDLTQYANQNITIELRYKTDEAVLEYGFVLDQLSVKSGVNQLFLSGAENPNELQLNGFSRINDKLEGESHNYYIQLRDYTGTDEKLSNISYEPGVLLWYRDQNISDNKVNDHPGEVFIGVVDADQNLIKSGQDNSDTITQIRDASFSLYDQSIMSGDTNLTNNALFTDADDYSAPSQAEFGLKLPNLGFAMEVALQSNNSSSATVTLSNTNIVIEVPLSASINFASDDLTVSLQAIMSGGDENYSYLWDFGDGSTATVASPNHTYAQAGNYKITLAVTDGNSEVVETSVNISVTAPVATRPKPNTNTSSSSGGGSVGLFALLSLLLLIVFARKPLRS